MSSFEEEVQQIFAAAAAEETRQQELREELAQALPAVLDAIVMQGVTVPEGVDVSAITVDHLDTDTSRAMQEGQAVTEEELTFYASLSCVVVAAANVQEDDPEQFAQFIVDSNAQTLLADNRMADSEKLKWAAVFRSLTGLSPLSSDPEEAIRQIREISQSQRNEDEEYLVRSELVQGLEEFLTLRFGLHDSTHELARKIMALAQFVILEQQHGSSPVSDLLTKEAAACIDRLSLEAHVPQAAIGGVIEHVIAKLQEQSA